MVDNANNELPDYTEFELQPDDDDVAQNGAAKPTAYTGVHTTSFKDMGLKA